MMFNDYNLNQLISHKLSEYILTRIDDKDFFKVQRSTGVLSWKLQDIVNRQCVVTKRTARAIEQLTRIAVSVNTKSK